MSNESGKMTPIKKWMVTNEFVIYDAPLSKAPRDVEKQIDQAVDMPREPSPRDDALSAMNMRHEYETHMIAPVINKGHRTGQYRVHFFRCGTKHNRPPFEKIPWDVTCDSLQEAMAWSEARLEAMRQRANQAKERKGDK